MSISNQFIYEKLIEGYVKTPLTLKELTLTKLAILLCQYSDLKRHIVLSEEIRLKGYIWGTSCPVSLTVLDELTVKQSFALCDKLCLPSPLRSLLIPRIRLLARRLLAWNQEHEIRLKMSPIAVNQFLLSSDWTMEGRINERKVAERLVQNEDIPLFDRYRLACLNCLEPYILTLWNQILPSDKDFFYDCTNNMSLVRIWSQHVNANSDLRIGRDRLLRLVKESVKTGQRTAFTYCWGIFNESEKQKAIVYQAWCALSEYDRLKIEFKATCAFIANLQETWFRKIWRATPEHYSDILYFLLSQMSEDQKVEFFQPISNWGIFECLLQSPNEGYFLPLVRKLWGILPKILYDELLLFVFDRFMGTERYNDKNLKGYDYEHLLIELLDAAPEDYKRYIFSFPLNSSFAAWKSGIERIFFKMFKKKTSDSDCRNIEVIHLILKQATVEEKRSLLQSSMLCEHLLENRYREILDSILGDVFSEEALDVFKKNFMKENFRGKNLCLGILAKGDKEYVDSLLHWGNLSETEINVFRSGLIDTVGLDEYISMLLEKAEVHCVDRILKYCLPTVAGRRQFKKNFLKFHAKDVCIKFTKYWPNGGLKKFLSWAFPKNKRFRSIFVKDISKSVLQDLMSNAEWRRFDVFSEECGLPPKVIEPLKVDVILSNKIVLFDLLCCGDRSSISYYLKCCLSDVESATTYKNELDKYISEATVEFEVNEKQQLKKTWKECMEIRLRQLGVSSFKEKGESRNVKRGGSGKSNPPKKLKKEK